MRSRISMLVVVMTVLLTLALTPAAVADSPKLVAPVYPGAVSAVPAEGAEANEPYVATFGDIKTMDCRGSRSSTEFKAGPLNEYDRLNADLRLGPWCFLTRDPIDKVKTFYEKAVGSMRPIQAENGAHGYLAYLERAWFEWENCEGEGLCSGFNYSGVSVHALPPPPVKGKTPLPATYGEGIPDQEDYLFYSLFKHLGLFHQSVAWYGPEPGKHKVADLDAVAKKYGYLESAFFQHKGPELAPVDVALGKHFGELQGQRQTDALMGRQMGGMQGMSAPQSGSSASDAEEAKFNTVMQKDPELARRYVALTQQVATLMQQGKYDEADAVMDEIDKLEQSNPELAAMNQQEQMRQDSLNRAGQAQEDAMDAAMDKQLDKAFWGTAMEYIEAVDKEAYYTLIVIDNSLTGYEKDYSNDRAVVDADTADRVDISGTDSFGIKYKQSFGDSGKVATQEEPVPEENKDDLKEEAKKLLKKWKPF